jgi:hypothetical protein
MASSDFLAAVRALLTGGVDFILVGGLAAVLNGAPLHTYDVDIVPSSGEENLTRLLRVLESIDAIYRIQPARRLKPEMSHLRSAGHQNLITKFGPLDVLGSIGRGLTYVDLVAHSVEMKIAEGLQVKVLDLPTIIAVKEELKSEKDIAALSILRRTLQEKRRMESQ